MAVFTALEQRDPQALRQALRAGGNPQAVLLEEVVSDHDSWTQEQVPLSLAVNLPGEKALVMVNLLLEAGATVQHPTADRNALVQAAVQQRWDLMPRLLDAAPVPSPDEAIEGVRSVGQQVLGQVLNHARADLLDRMVNDGWVLPRQEGSDGWLFQFLENQVRRPDLPDGWRATLDRCLTISPDAINRTRGAQGPTPLAMAVVSQHVELVEALIQRGADVNRPVHKDVHNDFKDVPELVWADDRIAPLHLAAGADLPTVCEVLLRHGADPLQRSATAWTLREAIDASHRGDVLPTTDRTPLTPLETAQRNGAQAAAAVIERALLRREVPPSPGSVPAVRPRL